MSTATAAQIREHYDSLAFIYRTFWGDHIHHGLFIDGGESPEDAQVKMLDHCVQLLDLHSGEKVLDVGCGHGGTLLHLARQHNCTGLGLTISPKQSRIASESAAKAGARQLAFQVENADLFEFTSAAFDIVWAMESSEHFAAKAKFLRNAAKALKPGGRFLLAAWTGSMQRLRVREVARAFLCPELWTAQEYSAAAQAAELKILHCEDLTTQVIRTWEICRQHARTAKAVVKLLPQPAREFVEGIDIILDAYRSGDLTYTVIAAQKTDISTG
jgi:cyclopropane fatty-acyl-phospholipid synthase-like methyltransferase